MMYVAFYMNRDVECNSFEEAEVYFINQFGYIDASEIFLEENEENT